MTLDQQKLIARLAAFFIALCGIGVFAASLAFDVAVFESSSTGRRATYEATDVLAIGWIGPLGLQFGWYANVSLALAWLLCAWMKRQTTVAALVVGILGFLLAASSFLTLSAYPLSVGSIGSAAKFVSFGPAIFLWTLSMATGALATMPGVMLEIVQHRERQRKLMNWQPPSSV